MFLTFHKEIVEISSEVYLFVLWYLDEESIVYKHDIHHVIP